MSKIRRADRRSTRHGVNVHAYLRFRDGGIASTVTHNLAREGAMLSATHPVQPGEDVIICLDLHPGWPSLECKGRVRWSRPTPDGRHHFGVRFLDLCEEERDVVAAFLQSSDASVLAAV